MSVNPSTVNTKPWQAVDVNSTPQNVIAGPGHVQGAILCNNDNAVRYARFFNMTAAEVVAAGIGATTSFWVKVPANGQVIIDKDFGIFYNGTALCIAATTTYNGAVNVTNNMEATVFYTQG